MALQEVASGFDVGIDPVSAGLESGSDTGMLDALFHHLQGNGSKVLGDAGLARFSPQRLHAIELGARSRAEDCLRDVQCLARLLALVLIDEDRRLRQSDSASAARHLGQLAQDCERWNLLAEHAAMYRAQQPVASEVARHWARWAEHFGEWPAPVEVPNVQPAG